MHLSENVLGLEASATMAVAALARELRAQGRDIIDLSAGEPDFRTPDFIAQAGIAAIQDGRTRYTPPAGLPELRQAIAEELGRIHGRPIDPAGIVVTAGAKQALFNACFSLFGPGDRVLVPSPYWTSYPSIVRLARAETVLVPTAAERGFRLSTEDLDAAYDERVRGLILNSPSNPTGAVYPREQVEAIGRWALEHGIWVVTDEIYEHLVYDGVRATPITAAVPELADTTLVLNGVAKTYSMTGWRVGWMHGPQDVIKAATSFQSHLCGNVSNVAQQAALAALSGPQDAVEEMRQVFDRRRRKIVSMLSEIPGVECPTPQGAFYAYPSVKSFLGKPLRGSTAQNTVELADLVLQHAEVAIVPGEAFGTPGYFRMSYALSDDDLVEGVSRLGKLLSEVA